MTDIIPVSLPGVRPRGIDRALITPSSLFLAGDENLRVLSWNTAPGVTIRLRVRFVLPDGQMQWLEYLHTPTTDRAVKKEVFPVSGGVITNVSIQSASGTPRVGQTFVSVGVTKGDAQTAPTFGVLLQGYVTTNQSLAWPGSPVTTSLDGGGYVRTFSGTTPAVGNQIIENVPTGARWELLSVLTVLTTAAGGSNRRPQIALSDTGVISAIVPAPGSVAPSSAVALNWLSGLSYATAIDPLYVVGSIGVGQPLLAGQTLTVAAVNLAAGDQFQAPVITVREWLEAL